MSDKKNKNVNNYNEVEYSHELADSADWDAAVRMKEANKRAETKKREK